MNLYLITPPPASYDIFPSAVVAAESEGDARLASNLPDPFDGWVVQFLGTADPSVEPGIVLFSYDGTRHR